MSDSREMPAPPASKSAYLPPAPVPTQEGPRGIGFDFNLGCRVSVPEGNGHVRLSDLDTGNILFERDTSSSFVNSTKRHIVRFRIEVSATGKSVFAHAYDAAERPLLFQLPVGPVGDTIGWFPYATKFKKKHGGKLTGAMSELMIPLFRDAYREIRFVTHEEMRRRSSM